MDDTVQQKKLTTEKFSFIRDLQKQYFEKFNEKLEIDFPKMKNISENYERITIQVHDTIPFPVEEGKKILKELCKKNKLDFEKMVQFKRLPKPYIPVMEYFSSIVYKKGWNKKEVSDFLGVHRTTILHHVRNYLKKQNSKEKKNINVSIK